MDDQKKLYILHRVLVRIAKFAVTSFFTEVRVIGGDHVPRKGPMIVTATHHNMMLDPAILSSAFPNNRVLHYWSKASLFANPVVRQILVSSGNIPVDRKSKDRRKLFQGTIDALSQGSAIALFPEGTSYTEPRIMQVKDGCSYAALEYTKWALENPERAAKDPVVIVPTAIVYTNKSKYRSYVIMEFGPPITMDPYIDQFLSPEEGAPRNAAKRLTKAIESRLVELTVNAPDWDTLYAARMARDLLWEDDTKLNRNEFVAISQTLVDLFSTPDVTPNFNSIKRHLLEYYSLLQSTQLTNSVLSSLPLPASLDPKRHVGVPSRLYTLLVLVKDTLAVLIRLPLFIFPLAIHMPAYIMARVGARLVEDEEETQAQNKVIFGLLLLLMIYPAAFFFVWALFWYTPIGAVIGGAVVALTAVYHTKLVNDNYEHAKRLIAAWRVLIGVWAPKSWEYPLDVLVEYTKTPIPPPNQWISTQSNPNPSNSTGSSHAHGTMTTGAPAEPPVTPSMRRKRRPRTRRVMKHVLRARVEAARALSSLLEQLENGPSQKKVNASAHLVRAYGGGINEAKVEESLNGVSEGDSVVTGLAPLGWRYAREVVAFLRKRGAKIRELHRSVEGDWAAYPTDGELSPAEYEDREDSPEPQDK